VREKYVVVMRGDGEVIWIVGGVGMRVGHGGSKVLYCLSIDFEKGLFADFGGGVVGGGVYSVKEGDGTARCWVLVDGLGEEVFVCLVDAVEDSEASRLSTKRHPGFDDFRLVKEYMLGLARDVSSGVGGRAMAVRWKRRLKRSIQAWSMEARKRRMKSSMPMSCGH
jgi:hypothetical protein